MTATTATVRYYAARSAGRYRVFDTTTGEDVEVAVCASRAKAEEKADRLNALEAADAAHAAEVAAQRAAEERAAQAAEDARVEAERVAGPELSAADRAAVDTAKATKAYRVGARLAAAAEAATAMPLGRELRAKLAAKTPAKDGTKLVHLTVTDASTLAQVAANLEGKAREGVTAGDLSAVSLVFSCTSAQIALAKLFA